jgi:hypothetical protein
MAQEARMSINDHADNLAAAVHYALETTRATAVCPFHSNVTVRVGDDAAPVKLSKVTARHGSGNFCSRKLVANLAMPQMVLALIVSVRILKHDPI